jgi:hypothetical protein
MVNTGLTLFVDSIQESVIRFGYGSAMASEGATMGLSIGKFTRAVLIGFLIGFAAILFLGQGQDTAPIAVASAIPGSADAEQPGTLQSLPHLREARLPRPVRT